MTASLPRACMYQGYWKDTKYAKELNQTNNKPRGSETFQGLSLRNEKKKVNDAHTVCSLVTFFTFP